MVYLDNAATTYPKPACVIDRVTRFLRYECGNPGRSSHRLSISTAEAVFDCRVKLAELLRFAKPQNICFTQNATYSLNIAIKGLITQKCHCIISDLEHNSVVRPLTSVLSALGGEYSVFNSDLPLEESVLPLIRDDTKFVISTIASNVTGKIIDPYAISKLCKEKGLKLILDASQYLGHRDIHLDELYFDALCGAGHKALFGLQGSGFIIFREQLQIPTLFEGGSGSNTLDSNMPTSFPERLEAGTLNTPAIIGLSSGLDFIKDYGIYNIEKKISNLDTRLEEILYSFKDKITVYGLNNGIACFNSKKKDASTVSQELDKYEICTRDGLHCAPLIHKKLGTYKCGALRLSTSVLTKNSDLDFLYYTLQKIL